MSRMRPFLSVALVCCWMADVRAGQAALHVWEKTEITLTAADSYANPYTDVTVWVDLKGPGFSKRCYGFWDGGKTFKVRVTATSPWPVVLDEPFQPREGPWSQWDEGVIPGDRVD